MWARPSHLHQASQRRLDSVRCDAHQIHWKPVATNIYTMVPFTWVRCVFFVGSMALYTTDVVRSGLGIQHLAAFNKAKIGVDTFYSFGPFAYPLQTIQQVAASSASNGSSYQAFARNDDGEEDSSQPTEIQQVKIWSYKFDTLSVGPRALAMELDVWQYPNCLLTTWPSCPSQYLSLETTFVMLDSLLDAIQKSFLVDGKQCAAFAVEHQWIDTIEQALFGLLRDEPFTRYLTLHWYRRNATHGVLPVELLDTCTNRQAPGYDLPPFCSSAKWITSFRLAGVNSSVNVSIDEHISLRFARFQVEHPDLDMELFIMTARNVQWIENSAGVAYNWDCEEILTLVRGRRCDPEDPTQCQTLVVDDYRYERSVLETNVEEKFTLVAVMRGFAQLYVWIRLGLLVGGIVASTWHETRYDESISVYRMLYLSWVNLLKVPSHVVVYGTLIPLMFYALAHLTDCYLYHLIVQDALSTTMGNDGFLQLRIDAAYVTLKMRNIWFIALLCAGIVAYNTHYRRREDWTHRMGVVGFRGTMMSFLSCATLLFPVRFPAFRQANVLSFAHHDLTRDLDSLWPSLRLEFSLASTGPFLEIRCFLLAVLALAGFMCCAKPLSKMAAFRMPQVMAHSTVIPYSAGIIWPTSGLTGYWQTRLARDRKRSSVVPSQEVMVKPEVVDKHGKQLVFVARRPSHIRALCIEQRSDEMWALIRLMNIVMMTSPLIFVRLRFIGVDLFLYRLKPYRLASNRVASKLRVIHAFCDADEQEVAFLLPDRLDKLYEINQLESADLFELIGVVNSKSLSWNELVMCG